MYKVLSRLGAGRLANVVVINKFTVARLFTVRFADNFITSHFKFFLFVSFRGSYERVETPVDLSKQSEICSNVKFAVKDCRSV
jgi:hypothetical protein